MEEKELMLIVLRILLQQGAISEEVFQISVTKIKNLPTK